MRITIPFMVLSMALFGTACEIGPESGAGLRLPNGDVAAGKQAFADLGCDECHTVAGEPGEQEVPTDRVMVRLGGHVPHIESHGELITSIVNPSHGFPRRYPREQVMEGDRSRMENFNQSMTVEQLIDLTEFLQSKYKLELNRIYGP